MIRLELHLIMLPLRALIALVSKPCGLRFAFVVPLEVGRGAYLPTPARVFARDKPNRRPPTRPRGLRGGRYVALLLGLITWRNPTEYVAEASENTDGGTYGQ